MKHSTKFSMRSTCIIEHVELIKSVSYLDIIQTYLALLLYILIIMIIN